MTHVGHGLKRMEQPDQMINMVKNFCFLNLKNLRVDRPFSMAFLWSHKMLTLYLILHEQKFTEKKILYRSCGLVDPWR